MPSKPDASGYPPAFVQLVRATCLYVATKLGDLIDDVTVVGGLVPSLLIDADSLSPDAEPHVGTMDLDLGLTLAIFDEERYQTLIERLRGAGFKPDVNADNKMTRQRWMIEGSEKVTVDFLIPPSRPDDRGGRLRNIESDLAAVIAPGLQLAFQDRVLVPLTGETILGEKATRAVWVCGPAAYIVLKALAFDSRGENKDAYDLYYVVRYHPAGVQSLGEQLRIFNDRDAQRAADILRRDFLEHEAVGPRRVAQFLTGGPDDVVQADVVGFVTALLQTAEGDEPE